MHNYDSEQQAACGRGIAALFAAVVSNTPGAVAVEDGARSLSYAQLDALAARIAGGLAARGVGAGDSVAVCLPRCLELPAVLLAILRLGANFVPLDPHAPHARRRLVLADAQPRLVVEAVPFAERNAQEDANADTDGLSWPRLSPAQLAAAPPHVGALDGQPLACIFYTSGTTGTPKGVEVPQAGIVRMAYQPSYLHIDQGCRVGNLSNPAFDALNFDLWAALLNGGCVVVISAEELAEPRVLAGVLRTRRVDALFLTTTLFSLLMEEQPQCLAQARDVLIGGEAMPAAALQAFFTANPDSGCRLHNIYGPTECSTFALVHEVPRAKVADYLAAGLVPIGKPIRATSALVVVDGVRQAAIGEAGELCLGGPGLALGYRHDPVRTAQAFVDYPWARAGRLYRSGDLVRYNEAGELEYLGRLDRQVKIRGHRVELLEIEGHLAAAPEVLQAAVLAHQVHGNELELRAYVHLSAERMANPAHWPEIRAELRSRLARVLPPYMCPSRFFAVAHWPRTANGKLDQAALQAGGAQEIPLATSNGSVNAVLASLLAECEAVLGFALTAHTSFVEAGGHSLHAMRVTSRLERNAGLRLSSGELLASSSLQQAAGMARPVQTLPSAAGCGPLPACAEQQRLFFLHQLNTGDSSYNAPFAFVLKGRLKLDALQAAISDLAARHDGLRRWVRLIDGWVMTDAEPDWSPQIEHLSLPPGWHRDALPQLLESHVQRPFDLSQPGGWRVVLAGSELDSPPQQSVLLLCFHHILIDGWSITLLLEELSKLYQAHLNGQTANLALPLAGYGDFIRQSQREDVRQLVQQQMPYWQQVVAQGQQRGSFTPLFGHAGVSNAAALHSMNVPQELWQEVRAASAEQGVTLFALLCSVFTLLLARHSGRDDFCIGTPVAGRGLGPFEETVGLFVNTLPLCMQLKPQLHAQAWLHHCASHIALALRHQDVPFNEIVSLLPARNTGNPLFDVMLVLENTDTSRLQLEGIEVSPLPLMPKQAKFALTLFVTEHADGGAELVLESQSALLAADKAQAFLAGFAWGLQQLVQHLHTGSESAVGQMSLLTPAQTAAVLRAAEGALSEPADSDLLLLALAHHVQTNPQAIAVQMAGSSQAWSWRELDQHSNALAHKLRMARVEAGQHVGVCMYRSPVLLAALLAIHKIGAAWLPLDPELPLERLRYLVEDGGVGLVLCEEASLSQAQSLPCPRLHLHPHALATENVALDAMDRHGPEHCAYVLYTSGSTGAPKGVPITRAGLANYLAHAQHAYCAQAGLAAGVVSSTLNFDATLTSLLVPLVAGKSVLLLAQDGNEVPTLQDLLRHAPEPMLFKLTPTHLQAILAYWQDGLITPVPHVLVIGGEALGTGLAQALRQRLPHAVLINEYGPTETVVGCANYRLPSDPAQMVNEETQPIGRALGNMAMYVLDQHGALCPPGTSGEICIAGPGLTPGYLGRADLNRQKFVYIHLDGGRICRVYRSGDLGCWHEDGQLRYLGRADQQMKLNGYRIEPGEIEARLCSLPGIAAAAVAIRPLKAETAAQTGAARLLAYVVEHQPGQISDAQMQQHLAAYLPKHMLPHAILRLPQLPVTLNGKLDRAALPDLLPPSAPAKPPQEAADQLQEIIAAAFSDALGYPIDTGMNFFEAGVTSLLLMKVHAQLQGQHQLSLKLTDFFDAPSVQSLALALAASGPQQGRQEDVANVANVADFASAHGAPEKPGLQAGSGKGTDRAQQQIAIVGIAVRMPGADDLAQFWQMVREGRECISPLAADAPGAAAAHPKEQRVKAVASMAGLYDFDPAYFGLADADARLMDPQQRHLLMGAVHALQNAGIAPLSNEPRAIGVVVASSENGHQQALLRAAGEEGGPDRFQMALLNEKDFVSSRLAYHLNLSGPALTVQSACSSSLSALHIACQMLRNKEAQACLVGGVAADPDLLHGYTYRAGRILSPDGHCRSFAEDAGGTVPANGMGMVVLKTLARAQADGDRIYALVLGSALGNDGQRKVSFTGPALSGQEEVICRALEQAGISAAHIGYLEAHGTATPIGDPVEVEALKRAFARAPVPPARQSCALASVKSQMGHMGAAAGVAGLIRASLALYHRYLPPSLGVQRVNPHLGLEASPFYVNTECKPWPAAQRYAGVSSFGMGGTNAHLVLGGYEGAAGADKPAWDAPGQRFALRTLVPDLQTKPPLKPGTGQEKSSRLPHEEWYLQESWVRCQRLTAGQPTPERRYLLAGASDSALAALRAQLQATDCQVQVLGAPEQMAALEPGMALELVWLSGADGVADFAALLAALQSWGRSNAKKQGTTLSLSILCPHSTSLDGSAQRSPESALLTGFALVAPLELGGLTARILDCAREAPAQDVAAALAALEHRAGGEHYALRGDWLWQRKWSALDELVDELVDGLVDELADESIKDAQPQTLQWPAGVYLVFGGSGGIGGALRAELARNEQVVVINMSRTQPPHSLQEQMQGGAKRHYHLQCDLSDARQMEACAAQIQAVFGTISGIIHAAGVGGSGLLAEMDMARVQRNMAAKVSGMRHLQRYFLPLQPKLIVLCSSMSALAGVPGQLDYAGANAWLDAWAEQHSNAQCRVISVNWPSWQDTGIAAGARSLSPVLQDFALTPAQAIKCLPQILQAARRGLTQLAICPVPLRSLRLALQTLQTRRGRASDPDAAGQVTAGDAHSRILHAFQQVLGNALIDPALPFYLQGGDSLSALDLLDHLQAQFPGQFRSEDVLHGEVSVAALARKLEPAAQHPAFSPEQACLLSLQAGRGRPLLMLHPVGGDVVGYRQLAAQLSQLSQQSQGGLPVLAVRDPVLLTHSADDSDLPPVPEIRESAARYLALLGEESPRALVGWSFGALLAWQIAKLLQEGGYRVPDLLLIDPPLLVEGEGGEPGSVPQEVFLQELRLQYPDWGTEWGTELKPESGAETLLLKKDGISRQAQEYLQKVILACRRNTQAAHRFRPQGQVQTRVELWLAQRNPQPGLLAQWQALCAEKLVVHERDADHYSIMQGGHAQAIAASLLKIK